MKATIFSVSEKAEQEVSHSDNLATRSTRKALEDKDLSTDEIYS
jgi:hypothetical protein